MSSNPRRWSGWQWFALCCGALAAGGVRSGGQAAVSRAPSYAVVDLGTPEGLESEARAINELGQVAGWMEPNPPESEDYPIHHAFYWSPEAGLQDLGTLGGPSSEANDVNDAGTVVGWADPPLTSPEGYSGFTWTARGGMRGLKNRYFEASEARAINRRGLVVGLLVAASQDPWPAMWADNGLRKIPNSWRLGAAEDVNNAGKIVYWSLISNGVGPRAFIDPGRRPVVPGRPRAYWDGGSHGQAHDQAFAVNERDEVAGTSNGVAFLSYGSRVRRLGGLPDRPYGAGLGLNDQGLVVGACSDQDEVEFTPSADQHAFLWDGQRMMDLNDLVPPGSGWLLNQAHDINDRGEIVGTGRLGEEGPPRAFLLAPRR